MRRIWFIFLCGLVGIPLGSGAATGRIIKVLPQFLDKEGRRARSPSLFDRDAYQAYLRKHPALRSGITFDIQWKTRGGNFSPLRLQVDLLGTSRGDLPSHLTLQTRVEPGHWFNHWTSLRLMDRDYRDLGNVTAWRVTLWEGDRLLGEEKSFLW